jgi:hypothetical protein
MRAKGQVARTSWRVLLAAVTAAVLAPLLPPGVAAAATIDEQVALDVTLDSPGTATIDAFDPALGTLTQVAVTITVDVLVQACIENRQAVGGAPATGSVAGNLAVEIPTGANTTTAGATATLPGTALSESNGTDDCAAGFSDGTGTFPAPVIAADVGYAEATDETTNTQTLTGAAAQAFVGTGTVTVAHTPTNDTELAVPDEWDAVAVAVGGYQVDVTYTYTPAAAAPAPAPRSPTSPGSGSGGGLSTTGIFADRAVLVAIGLLALGTTTILIARRRRSGAAGATSTVREDTQVLS